MTRLLVFSDIHGAIPAVHALVESESRDFDGVIVAGDIGDPAADFFRALEPLGCPVFYVYGNWDHKLEYNHVFNDRAIHLHGVVGSIQELQIVGFSGCDIQWGENPKWLTLRDEVETAHSAVLGRLSEARAADERCRRRINDACNVEACDIENRTRDKRRRSYKARLNAVERKRYRLRILKCCSEQRIRESRKFEQYVAAIRDALREVAASNRAEVIDRIRKNCDPKRTILVSHERLYRLPDDIPGLGIHLFGHRHGFKVTAQHGTVFVNVSTLDPHERFSPQYGVLEWTAESGFRVTEKSLPGSENLWSQCANFGSSPKLP